MGKTAERLALDKAMKEYKEKGGRIKKLSDGRTKITITKKVVRAGSWKKRIKTI